MNQIKIGSYNWLVHKINNQALVAHIGAVAGRVVDLGCGTAPYKAEILNRADEYVGVDWKNSFHDQSNVDIFANLSEGLPFHDACADTVVSFQVMEHLAEPGIFLSECYRILRSKGRLLITVPFMWHVHEAPYDYFRYTRYGLGYLLRKAGFMEIQVTENTGFWQMWVLKFNYHTARVFRGPFRLLMLPMWWLDQVIAPVLDRYDIHPEETGSYTVLATKP